MAEATGSAPRLEWPSSKAVKPTTNAVELAEWLKGVIKALEHNVHRDPDRGTNHDIRVGLSACDDGSGTMIDCSFEHHLPDADTHHFKQN